MYQNYPVTHFEVLVIRNGIKNFSQPKFISDQSFPFSLRVIDNKPVGPSAARNLGIAKARFDTIIFLDDDCVVKPTLLRTYAEAWTQFDQATIIGGPVSVGMPRLTVSQKQSLRNYPWCFAVVNHGKKSHWLKFDESLVTANLSFDRRRVPRAIDGNYFYARLGAKLDLKTLLVGEDWELCLRVHRAGGLIAYSAQTQVENQVELERFSFRYLWRRHWKAGLERVITEYHLATLFPLAPLPSLWQETGRKTYRSLRKISQRKIVGEVFWQNLALELSQLFSYTFYSLKLKIGFQNTQ
jgi:glycosyltransferase involved in cell wall biosynthesis